jgi:uncharacterized SAM-binding protein YcdF (DUF218 family)
VTRVLVVLGYSNGARDGLHPVCAARLTKAAELSTDADVVVFSGWSKVPGTRSEAELMARAWQGRAAELVVDPDARTTAENAANALDDIRRAAALEVVVVTSGWHAARARAAFRWLLRGSHIHVTVASPPGRSRRVSLRELALWPLLPVQLYRASRPRRGSAVSPASAAHPTDQRARRGSRP